MNYIHLHTHSHYSLLNALPKINAIVDHAKEHGSDAIALTDDGNLYGAIEFYKTCKKNDIKPIIGVDFYVAIRTRHDKVSGIDNRRYRLVLLAKNYQGYCNLMKLVSLSHQEGFYYKPRIDRELLQKYHSDLIAIIPQFSGETSVFLKINDIPRATETWDFYQQLFGDNLYLEILHHEKSEQQTELRSKIETFAADKQAQTVATSDSYYLHPEDKSARDVLVDVGNVKSVNAARDEIDFSMHSPQEMQELFSGQPQAIENTAKIAAACNLEIELGDWTFPTFPLEGNQTPAEVLRAATIQGADKKGIVLDSVYQQRIDYELEVIGNKGYDIYFLVVADLMKYARSNRILTNTRGSAAGCLVSYLIGITNIDPIEYKLPFERFLNPERPSPPDIDIDIADDKRDQLIAYVREKYGEEQVAQIGTFGTMAARGAVKDAARAMGFDYQMGDKISKLIPFGSQGFAMTIERAIEEEPELSKLYDKDKEVARIIDMAKTIEGSARHISIHAAGVVIAPSSHNGVPTVITDFTPVQQDPKGSGKLITQYNMHAVEDVGLLKYDFLGLKNLTVIHEAMRRIKKIRNIDIDLDAIPLDDPQAFAMLAQGDTYGVFQMSGDGMTKWLKELKPTTIHDINAMVALYRPGPMEFIPEYIKRKYNPRLITYIHPILEKILEQSFGVITYQDDVMMIAIEVAGYTWLEADMFRKAMGKKIPELMAEQKEKFYAGCLDFGLTQSQIDTLWENIETFAAYGFNKSHAAAYGNIAYKTAYLKANYPSEYMAALLTADSGNNENIGRAVRECEHMGIPVLPPDINESFEGFSVVAKESAEKNQIRFGLYTIKNFGENISHLVIDERNAHGPYTSLSDFIVRINNRDLNKKSLEALTLSGALDSLEDRNKILGSIEMLLQYAKESRDKNSDQDSLFAHDDASDELSLPDYTDVTIALKTGMNDELRYTLPMSNKDKLFWEKELLGLYVSGHPLDRYRKQIESTGNSIVQALQHGMPQGKYTFAGIFSDCRKVVTKQNRRMAFATLSDTTGEIPVTCFADVYKTCQDLLVDDAIVQVAGTLQKRNGEWGLLIDSIKELQG